MIRVLFKKMLDEKAFRERRRITLSEVVEQTGISRTTLTRIANVPGYNVTCLYMCRMRNKRGEAWVAESRGDIQLWQFKMYSQT